MERTRFMAIQPTPISKFKLFLVSYTSQNSSDNLHPSVSGGSWIEVGTFEKAALDKAVASIAVRDIGGLGGPNGGSIVKAISVQIS